VEGLAAKRAAGVGLGRPQALSPETVTRIINERAAGKTLQAIADGLMLDAVPTARGGSAWRPSPVAAVLRSRLRWVAETTALVRSVFPRVDVIVSRLLQAQPSGSAGRCER
jgi:hypothetical protein